MDGGENCSMICYNSRTKNLSVAFTSTSPNGTQATSYLYHIVDLNNYLPDRVIVGFSAATGSSSFALHRIISWNFTSTSLDGENTTYHAGSLVPVPRGAPAQKTGQLAIALGIGGSMTVVGALCIGFFLCKKRVSGESDEDPMVNDSINEEFEKQTSPRKFSYNEFAHATRNFVEGEKLGEGGFGGVYKGFLKHLNSYVAVKRVSKGSKQGVKEYASEVTIISRLRHRNLVQLIGWCHEKRELLLVYEFMPNGSLDCHLFNAKSFLTWEVRYKIAQGLASGLLYLHEGWEQCVLHRDIKPSNVLLDSNFNAKLGDFGLARLMEHGKQSQTTILAGTMGYMAPEYVTTGQARKESDVYSFGVVALEIACGRKAIDPKLVSSHRYMVEWVWNLYEQGKVLEAVDPKLCGDFDEKQMECFLIVGLWCAHKNYNIRPSIQQAIQLLKFEAPFPTLPSNTSMETYSAATGHFERDSETNSSQFTA